MLKMSELNGLIPEAKARFVEKMARYPETKGLLDATPIYLCNRENAAKRHDESVKRCGSFSGELLKDTGGELIYGNKGEEVLLYQYAYRSLADFKEVLWHEWGHVLSNSYMKEITKEKTVYFVNRTASIDPHFHEHLPADEKEYQENLNYGAQLWSEFISDVIYYEVLDGEPHSDVLTYQRHLANLLEIAVGDTPIRIDTLGHYCAMVLADQTVACFTEASRESSIGLEFVPDFIAHEVDDLLCLLADQMQEDNMLDIDKATILEFGAIINRIWDYNADRRFVECWKSAVKNSRK